jgi:hypothetical protein
VRAYFASARWENTFKSVFVEEERKTQIKTKRKRSKRKEMS